MKSLARVEDRVSIVYMCTPVLVLRNLEVDPVQTAVPLLSPHQFFPFVFPWFRPTRQSSATNCGFSVSVSCTKSTVSRYCNVFTNTPRTGVVTVAKVRILCTRSGSIVILLPPTHQQGSRNNQRHRMSQRCTIMTKTCFAFRTACLCPNSCATRDDRQMRMTDKNTPHFQSRSGTYYRNGMMDYPRILFFMLTLYMLRPSVDYLLTLLRLLPDLLQTSCLSL